MEEEEWLWILASVRCCLIVSEHLHPFIMMMMIWSVHFAPFCCLILYSFYFFNKMLPTLSITHIPIQRIKSQLPLLLCHLTSLFWVFFMLHGQLNISFLRQRPTTLMLLKMRKWSERKLKLNGKTFKIIFKGGQQQEILANWKS